MTKALATDMVLEQLESALGAGQFPAEAKQRGALLLSRLKSPVQIVLLGREGSGKSRLANMLLGDAVMPTVPDVPALEIAAGPVPRTVYLMEDGSSQQQEAGQPVPPGTAMVRVEYPLPVLNKLNLTEVSLTGSPANQKAAADWAMQRADIVLWCTQSFDATEQALWSSAQDALKDHSFLVLTKADQLLMKGTLPERIAQLGDIVAEEFYSLFPVATLQAITARGPDGTKDKDLWDASGGKALSDAIVRLVDTGRSADTDNARMFLSRYAAVLPQMTNRAKPAAPKPAPSVATPQPAPQATAQQAADMGQAAKEVFNQALEFLKGRANTLISTLDENGPDRQANVLDHCLETASTLTDMMMDIDLSSPTVVEFQDDVQECTDMMVLFQLEKTEDAAADAVTLLLQLKKEMSEAAVA
ncbi:MAG: hypothetical protein ACI8R4_000060 [Paracoccaceae bacterium]|jgi:hypothetical protein